MPDDTTDAVTGEIIDDLTTDATPGVKPPPKRSPLDRDDAASTDATPGTKPPPR